MPAKTLSYPYFQALGIQLIQSAEWSAPVRLTSENTVGYQSSRWEIISANPVELLSWPSTDERTTAEAIIETVHEALERHISHPPDNHASLAYSPFQSGAIGLATYDTGAALLNVDSRLGNKKRHEWPDLLIGIYQWSLVLDHEEKKCWLYADSKFPEHQLNDIRQLLEQISRSSDKNPTTEKFQLTSDWTSSFNANSYQAAFRQLQRYIAAGDCYQANLTTQYSATYRGDELAAANTCWSASPAPFESLMAYQNMTMISCSPERFIRIDNGKVSTQPIKGTRPRDSDPTIDNQLAQELKLAAKDRAENVMIVDLMRNDLGRFCLTGSVDVPRLFDVESYSNVHHLVSEISGEIAANDTRASLELFFGCIPGGSITGAPKKRAIEIIAELEPHQRSIYCGSVFYLNNNGNLDSNILIRSLLFERNQLEGNPLERDESKSDEQALSTLSAPESGTVYCWGGGGIVADSNHESEWAESRVKINNLLDALIQ